MLPLLELCSGLTVVATDQSEEQLRILRALLDERGNSETVICVRTDATADIFRAESFDLVIGRAILHHLIDPVAALAVAHAALRPGGVATFAEPLEGNSMLMLAFRLILREAAIRGTPLSPALERFLNAMCTDFAARAGRDKAAEHFRYMDDKWLFTRRYLEDAASAAGFQSVRTYPVEGGETMFVDGATALRFGVTYRAPDALVDYWMGVGIDIAALGEEPFPPFARELLELCDRSFSNDMKDDLTLSANLVFEKIAES